MSIVSGQYVVPVLTADGETVGLGCEEVTGATDDLVTPFLTADDELVPLKVEGGTTTNDLGFSVLTADDENGFAKAGSAGTINGDTASLYTAYGIYTLPEVSGVSGSYWKNATLTPTPNAETIDVYPGYIPDNIYYVLYIGELDESGFTVSSGSKSAGYFNQLKLSWAAPRPGSFGSSDQMTYTRKIHFINSTFDPSVFDFSTAGSISKTQVHIDTPYFQSINRQDEAMEMFYSSTGKASASYSTTGIYGVLMELSVNISYDLGFTAVFDTNTSVFALI